MVKDCDPATGQPDSDEGYDDEYILEDLEVTVADQIQMNKTTNFSAAWDAAANEGNKNVCVCVVAVIILDSVIRIMAFEMLFTGNLLAFTMCGWVLYLFTVKFKKTGKNCKVISQSKKNVSDS